MHTQLQDGVHLPACVLFDIDQTIDVPGVQYQRLFTDGIGASTQGEAHVAVVQVVGRANGHVIDSLTTVRSSKLIDMTIKTLEFGEEIGIREVAVDDA